MLVVDYKERRRLMKYRDPARDLLCTAEHLTPLSQGGSNTRSNIVAACAECNSGRHHWAPGRTMDQRPTLADVWPKSDWPWLAKLMDGRLKQVGYGPW